MILYLLKFTLCSATLLLFYKLVLEREKLLRFNRFYLLGSLVLALVLPLISFEIPSEQASLLITPNYLSVDESTSFVVNSVYNASKTTTSEGMA